MPSTNELNSDRKNTLRQRRINALTLVLFIIIDIAEAILIDLKSLGVEPKGKDFNMKLELETMFGICKRFRKAMNSAYESNPVNKQVFGMISDEIKDFIYTKGKLL